MSSNYLFAFNRSRQVSTATRATATRATATNNNNNNNNDNNNNNNKAVTLQDRFSLNRLIHYKATGSCRSCS